MSDLSNKIKKELETFRPHLQADGGDIEFLDFDQNTGILKVMMKGACVSCPMQQMTLEQGIGRGLQEKFPEIKKVVAV
jgi:Fe-S cluster biogenesis protein NfuA